MYARQAPGSGSELRDLWISKLRKEGVLVVDLICFSIPRVGVRMAVFLLEMERCRLLLEISLVSKVCVRRSIYNLSKAGEANFFSA